MPRSPEIPTRGKIIAPLLKKGESFRSDVAIPRRDHEMVDSIAVGMSESPDLAGLVSTGASGGLSPMHWTISDCTCETSQSISSKHQTWNDVLVADLQKEQT
jgi:hypothetical protein